MGVLALVRGGGESGERYGPADGEYGGVAFDGDVDYRDGTGAVCVLVQDCASSIKYVCDL